MPGLATKIDLSKLDVLFLLDTTSSMGAYIEKAKTSILQISEELVKSERCELRMGLVKYRDHPPEDSTYTTQVADLTDRFAVIKANLAGTEAQGGGDFPEAVCCAMNDCAHNVTWRDDAVKIAILIADAPPHGLKVIGDRQPNGKIYQNSELFFLQF